MRTIFLDIETTAWFDAPEIATMARWQQIAWLGWGLAVTWDADCGWREWASETTPALWEELTDLGVQVVTWNGDEFDLPRVAVEARRHSDDPLMPELVPLDSLDLMAWIIAETKRLDGKGRWYKLDLIAQANLGRGKIADGKQAAIWLAGGSAEERAQAAQYCRDDVQLLIDLHARLVAGEPLICPARPERREYRELRLTLADAAAYAAERAAAQGGAS
jgi:hypothetical protein